MFPVSCGGTYHAAGPSLEGTRPWHGTPTLEAVARVLVLAGTTEATELAGRLTAEGHDVTSSLAGLTRHPVERPGQVRRGGFGGTDGLARYLTDEGIEQLVDATHPFAAGHAVPRRRGRDQRPASPTAGCSAHHGPRSRATAGTTPRRSRPPPKRSRPWVPSVSSSPSVARACSPSPAPRGCGSSCGPSNRSTPSSPTPRSCSTAARSTSTRRSRCSRATGWTRWSRRTPVARRPRRSWSPPGASACGS